MELEKRDASIGGRSLIALILASPQSNVNEADANYASNQLDYIREQIPDLHFIYYAGGNTNRFERFVYDFTQDIYPLNLDSNSVGSSADPVLNRLTKGILTVMHNIYFYENVDNLFVFSSTSFNKSPMWH